MQAHFAAESCSGLYYMYIRPDSRQWLAIYVYPSRLSSVACKICISVPTPGLSKQVLSGLVTHSMCISDTTLKSMAGQMARHIQIHV